MAITIEPLGPVFGARVTGFSAQDGVDDATAAEIEAAFNQYSVLHFPDQPVTDEAQIAFSERFGPLEATLAGTTGSGSKIVTVSNLLPDGSIKDPDGQRALFTRANELWHTDSSFKETPAKASLLSARRIPPTGGDTEFASTRAGYAALPDETKAQIEGLIARHDLYHSRRKLSPRAMTEEQRQAHPPVLQALVRTNPVNGNKSMQVGSHVSEILGMETAVARALNDDLIAASARPEFTYRHAWSVDDMVMWDNRCVLHRGHSYDEVNHRRVMIRTTISDDGPTVVDGQIQPGV